MNDARGRADGRGGMERNARPAGKRRLPARIGAVLLAGATTLAAGSAAADSLVDALSQAYVNNPQLLSERAALRAVDEQLPQALSGWRPTVSVTGQAGVTSSYSRTITGGNQFTGRPLSSTLTINQPIVQGGETFHQVDRAKNVIQAQRAQLFTVEQSVLLQAATAYVDVVRDTAVLGLSINNQAVLEEQLNATRDRFEVGELTRTDVAQAEARLANAVSNATQARGDLSTSIATYERVIGPLPTELVRPTPLLGLPSARDAAIQLALANNPSVASAKFGLAVAENDIDIAIAQLLPTLSLNGELSYSQGSSATIEDTSRGAVTAQLTIPLYQSGAEYAAIRAARDTQTQRQRELDNAQRQTIEAVNQAWDDLQTARATLVAFEAQVRAQEIALEGTRQESTVGTRTILDVLDAEQELFQAQVDVVQAQRAEILATYALASAVGGLTARQLSLPVTYYDVTSHFDDVKDDFIGTE